jgi:DNA-binding CsgD family transcriptional regulator
LIVPNSGRWVNQDDFHLSPRELEICVMIRGGLTSKEISRLLNITAQTVDKHRQNIRKKLGLNDKDANLTSFITNL